MPAGPKLHHFDGAEPTKLRGALLSWTAWDPLAKQPSTLNGPRRGERLPRALLEPGRCPPAPPCASGRLATLSGREHDH